MITLFEKFKNEITYSLARRPKILESPKDYEYYMNNKDKGLVKGTYNMIRDGEEVGGFSIRKVGDVEIDPEDAFELDDKKIFKNSIYLSGGFIVNYDKHKQGIGKSVIKNLFKKNPDLENIFLYAIDWQGAVEFWHKIGGKSILEKETGLHYIQLNKKMLSVKITF